jgi:predicted O-linked N-acetylglucosamine transferase (SPINDLY family)
MMIDRFREAMSLHQVGAVDEAEGIYRECLREDPNHAGAWHLLGVALHSRRELPAALKHIEKAISLCDSKAAYWNNYGAVLKDLGRLADAKLAFERALSIRDEYADAWSNLGLMLSELGHLDEAEKSIRYALSLEPHHADALRHLAAVYLERGEHEEALRLCRDAAAVAPEKAEVYRVEGRILVAMKRFEEAAAALDHAIALDPEVVDSYLNQGFAYADLDETEKARESYLQAASLRPELPTWHLRHLSLCPTIFATSEEISNYRAELESRLDATLADPPPFDWRQALRDGFSPPFQLSHHGVCNRRLKEKYAELFARHFPQRRPKARQSTKIRVGFVCTRSHEGGFIRGFGGIMERLCRGRFEVVGLVSEAVLPFCRRAVRSDEIAWIGFPHNLERALELFAQAECDVVMHWHAGTDVMNYFLPFLPLAPIQCIGFGAHGTTGIANIDHFVSSGLFERGEDAKDDYTENLVQFRGSTAWQARPPDPGRARRSDFGLPDAGTLYFCPQRHVKFHPNFDHMLRQILAAESSAHIVILRGDRRKSAEALHARLVLLLGETLARRVVFVPSQNPANYYRLLSLMDVVLDTPAYSASLTGYDAFAFGIPVVTMPGSQMVQRYAHGLYTKMGLGHLAVSDEKEYVHFAVCLGRDPALRQQVRTAVRERNEALFEDHEVIREYETFFEETVHSVS